MEINSRKLLFLEKRSVYFVNLFLILLFIFFLFFDFSLNIYFYTNILLTFFLSYFFFMRSKKLAKMLIITNLFIFFYFLYPIISPYIYKFIGSGSYIFILFYNILVAYVFLYISGYSKTFLGNLKKFKWKLFALSMLLGLVLGLFFGLVKEPIPQFLYNLFVSDPTFLTVFLTLFFTSLVVAFSEQMIFSGFLFNVYRNLSNKKSAFLEVSSVFLLFHMLRAENLINHYKEVFLENFIFYIIGYYFFLLIFILLALYLYSFKGKNYEGNFFYSLMLHFMADFSLFFYLLVL